jgi:hypothetical protein
MFVVFQTAIEGFSKYSVRYHPALLFRIKVTLPVQPIPDTRYLIFLDQGSLGARSSIFAVRRFDYHLESCVVVVTKILERMPKVIDLLNARCPEDRPLVSLEYFPPRTDEGVKVCWHCCWMDGAVVRIDTNANN